MEASSTSPASTSTATRAHSASDTAGPLPEAPLDARALVAKLVAAGVWPEPELLAQIASQGDAAVESLLEILRSKPRGWPAEATLDHAMALLQKLRPLSAIPELLEIIKSYPQDSGERAAEVIASFGDVAFEPLLRTLADPAVRGYSRSDAITAARYVSSANPAFRTRLADLVRPMLADAIERMRKERIESTRAPSSGNVSDREEGALDLSEEILFLVADLTSMADPLGRDLIKTAFAEDMVETFFLDLENVDQTYAAGGDPPWVQPDLVSEYAASYRAHLADLDRRNQAQAFGLSQPPRAQPSPSAAHARALMAKLVAAGRWPSPELLGEIVSAGDAAVEPLREILRTTPDSWPAKATLIHASRLLSTLRPAAAVPDLAAIIRRRAGKAQEEAAQALARFGTDGFEALLDLCRDPAIDGYRRVDVTWAAKSAAGDDPVLKARLAEALRSILEGLIVQAREERRQQDPLGLADLDAHLSAEGARNQTEKPASSDIDDDLAEEEADLDDDWDEDDDFEDDEEWEEDEELDDDSAEDEMLEDDERWGEEEDFEGDQSDLAPERDLEIGFIVSDLADLADPLAVDLIAIAFDEQLVDETFIDQEEVDLAFRHGAPSLNPRTDWLEVFRRSYERHIEAEKLTVPSRSVKMAGPTSRHDDPYDLAEPPHDIAPVAPIVNTGPRLGRNDPCWCGSGKKYKKCHLGKETPA